MNHCTRLASHIIKGLLCVVLFILSSCSEHDDIASSVDDEPCISSFSILKKNNMDIDDDIITQVLNDTIITAYVPGMKDSLIPSFSGIFDWIKVGGINQISGVSKVGFKDAVVYKVGNNNGFVKNYSVCLYGLNGLPRVDVITENRIPVTSKTEYVNAIIKISNSPGTNFEGPCQVRCRGNHVMYHPNKPYKVKLDKKADLFCFGPHKDWILFDHYCDKSLMRTSLSFEVSKAMGTKFTCNYKYVDLYLNGEYYGTYLLTDQVEKGKGRVEIDDDGFFIEQDHYYDREPLYFKTDSLSLYYTFKYPNPDKGKIVEGDSNYDFICNYMNEVEYALLSIEHGNKRIRNLLDYNSFAKWFLIVEVTSNFDPNFYLSMVSRNSKLEMYPIWDTEYSLGLVEAGEDFKGVWALPPHVAHSDFEFWKDRYFFKYLLKDEEFVNEVKKEWEEFCPHISEINLKFNELREVIKYSQVKHFEKWPILDNYLWINLVALGSWEAEVDYLKKFFNERCAYVDKFVNNL